MQSPPQALIDRDPSPASEDLIRYVEHMSDARTKLREERVSALGDWAGEETDFSNILLERSGWSKLCMESAIRIERRTSGLVIGVFGGFTPMGELMHERDHLPDLLF